MQENTFFLNQEKFPNFSPSIIFESPCWGLLHQQHLLQCLLFKTSILGEQIIIFYKSEFFYEQILIFCKSEHRLHSPSSFLTQSLPSQKGSAEVEAIVVSSPVERLASNPTITTTTVSTTWCISTILCWCQPGATSGERTGASVFAASHGDP